MTKSQTKSIYRALGSVDIIGASRSALMIGMNPNVPEERAVVHIKCSNAKKGQALTYTIGNHGSVQWHGLKDITDDDLERAVVRQKAGVTYDDDPIVMLCRKLVTENPGGVVLSYADLETLCINEFGYPLARTSNEMKIRLEGLAEEALKNDSIRIFIPSEKNERPKAYTWNGEPVTPAKATAQRCIHIGPVGLPKSFQTVVDVPIT